MKNRIFLVLVCILLLSTSVDAARIADGPRLVVSLVSQDPDPVSPGEVMDLRFKVENQGGGPIEDIIFEFIEEYPFSIYTGSSEQDIGSLQGLQNAEEAVIVHYEIKVDEDAVQGTHLVDIKYKSGQYGQWAIVKDFPIRIRTRDLVVAVESVKSDPVLISPGEDFELSFSLRNNADSLIRDVTAKLDLSSDSIPFAPSSSTAEKQIYQISSRTGKIVKFNLLALPDADGGIYKVPLEITYTDETGESYSKDDFISLKVSSEADLLATIDSSDIQGEVKSGIVIIKIVNRGLTDIKLLSAELLSNNDFEVISEPEVYVGNIDSDDYETVEFNLDVMSYDKVVKIPVKVSYRDATNKQYVKDLTLTLKTDSPGRIVSIVKMIFGWIIYLAILAGIVLGIRWFIWKRKNKKRKG